jgi:hypothetical protein
LGGELQYKNNILTCQSKIDALVWITENFQNSTGVCICEPEKMNVMDLIEIMNSHIFLPFWKIAYVSQWDACWISMNSLCCLLQNKDEMSTTGFEQILEVPKKEFVIQCRLQSTKESQVEETVEKVDVVEDFNATEAVYLNNLEQKTHYFLLYYNEDISEYNHPNVTPIKLSEEYFLFFESRGFLQLDISNLPDVDNIGFITPSFYRKSGIQNLDEISNITLKNNEIIGFFLTNVSTTCLREAVGNHGQNFTIIWTYYFFDFYELEDLLVLW